MQEFERRPSSPYCANLNDRRVVSTAKRPEIQLKLFVRAAVNCFHACAVSSLGAVPGANQT